MFTAQRNIHNDIIVCLGNKPEKGYWVVFTGSFFECNQIAKGCDI
jgi:hypothetical protein